jgi:hypothetical protein
MVFEKGRHGRDSTNSFTHCLRGPYLDGVPAPGREGEQPGHAAARAASDPSHEPLPL